MVSRHFVSYSAFLYPIASYIMLAYLSYIVLPITYKLTIGLEEKLPLVMSPLAVITP